MIVQRVHGTRVEQLFIDQARLVIEENAITGSTMVMELDVTPTDPRYTKVEVELVGRVRFIKKKRE